MRNNWKGMNRIGYFITFFSLFVIMPAELIYLYPSNYHNQTHWLEDHQINSHLKKLESDNLKIKSYECSTVALFNNFEYSQAELLKISHENILELTNSLENQNIVIFPINNANSKKEDGSHWSLLVYVKNSNNLYYYDSLKNYNTGSVEGIIKLINDSYPNIKQPKKLLRVNCPKQSNNDDCGYFLISFVEFFVNKIKGKESNNSQFNYEDESFWIFNDDSKKEFLKILEKNKKNYHQ